MELLTLGLLLFGAGAFTGGVGAFMGQSAQNQALEFNALMMEQNARLANMRALETEKEGQRQEMLHRLKVEQLKGSQRAAAAASGALVTEGSPMDILFDTERLGEMDAMTLRYNAAMEAWGHKMQGVQYGTQASMYRAQRLNPWLSFGTSLLGGAGQLTNMYMLGKKG